MWRAIGLLATSVVLVVCSAITAAAGAPRVVAWVLLILIAPCLIAAYVLASASRKRSRTEQEALQRSALSRIKDKDR
jgi:hypothetical protein